MYLYHYFDQTVGPFRSISDLPVEDANKILEKIKETKPTVQSALRDSEYVQKRRNCEQLLREKFLEAGGTIKRNSPHYMVIEHSPWLYTWYEHPAFIKIPIEEFDLNTLSFTYGDSMPTFSPRVKDGKEYRGRIYKYDEILDIIKKYGLPQDWNNDGAYGPERYIEVHVWSDDVIRHYL